MGIIPLQNEEHMQRQEEYVVKSKKTNDPLVTGYIKEAEIRVA